MGSNAIIRMEAKRPIVPDTNLSLWVHEGSGRFSKKHAKQGRKELGCMWTNCFGIAVCLTYQVLKMTCVMLFITDVGQRLFRSKINFTINPSQ